MTFIKGGFPNLTLEVKQAFGFIREIEDGTWFNKRIICQINRENLKEQNDYSPHLVWFYALNIITEESSFGTCMMNFD